MIFLSAITAVSGLLVGSPAVVVGSMVIAPIVGPVLTVSVGAVTGDREMLLHSVWLQAAGLGVAVGGAAAFSYGLQLSGFFPRTLDVASIDLIALRVAPNLVTVAIGLAAGAAGAFGLTTNGPTSLIGVMIAAALIPAATVGIAAAWSEYRLAVGSLALLLLTMILINVGTAAVLRRFYGPGRKGWLSRSQSSFERLATVGTILALAVLVAIVGVGAYQQIAFERTVNTEIETTFDRPEYGDTAPVTVRIQYIGDSFGSPALVTVVASWTADGSDPPTIADDLNRRITETTDREVAVRVRFQEYHRAGGGATESVSVGDRAVRGDIESPHRERIYKLEV